MNRGSTRASDVPTGGRLRFADTTARHGAVICDQPSIVKCLIEQGDLLSTDFDFDQLDAGVAGVADLVTTAGIEEAPLSRLVELEAHGS